jgi:hypothetical protein
MQYSPSFVANRLQADAKALESLKTDPTFPLEPRLELLPHQEILASHPLVPLTCHAREHFGYYTKLQTQLTMDALECLGSMALDAEKTLGETSEEKIQAVRYEALHSPDNLKTIVEALETSTGHPVKEIRQSEFMGSMFQIKFTIPSTPCRALHISAENTQKANVQLVRRHTKAPGLAFLCNVNETTRPYMTHTETHLMTVRYGSPHACVIGLGTGFAGMDKEKEWPGLEKDGTGSGILYKYYKTEEERKEDARRFAKTLETWIPCILNPVQFQEWVMSN